MDLVHSDHTLLLSYASLYHDADHAGPWSLLFLSPPPDSLFSKGWRHISGMLDHSDREPKYIAAKEIILMDLAAWS